MAKNSKQTSRKVASTASRILRDSRYSKASKSLAGSALAQTKPKKQSAVELMGLDGLKKSASPLRGLVTKNERQQRFFCCCLLSSYLAKWMIKTILNNLLDFLPLL